MDRLVDADELIRDIYGAVLDDGCFAASIARLGARFRSHVNASGLRLQACQPAPKHAIDAALAAIRANPSTVDAHAVVLRPDPLQVELANVLQLIHVPVRGALSDAEGRVLAVLVPLQRIGTDAVDTVLRLAFRATPGESRLARVLWRTGQLDAAASQLSISPSTARSHLKSLFRKTGTHQQSELIRLVDRLQSLHPAAGGIAPGNARQGRVA